MHIIEIHPYNKSNQDEIDAMVNEIANEFLFPIFDRRKSTLTLDKYWVAYSKNELIGTVGILNIDNNFFILKNMFVKKEFRGKEFRISQLLLKTVFDWSIKEGISSIYLGTMHQFIAAQKFYEKNGFKKIIKSKLPLTFITNPLDDVFYKKKLKPQIYRTSVKCRLQMDDPIVSPDWLNNNIDDPDLIILDASQLYNKSGSSSEFDNLQIPGAITIDFKKDFSLKSTSLPNMMLDAEQFQQACRRIGVNKSSKILVYDNLGIYFSPRVWWMFKLMGHKEISVLNGGFPNWISQGFETESKNIKEHKTGNFCSLLNGDLVKNFDDIKENIKKREFILIDARASNRFRGTAPEPRPNIQSGNIENSINLPFNNVLENGKLKSKEELIKVFEDLQIENRPLTFSCGSGITACIILLACELVCENSKSVYDGSWTEWAERTQV